MIFVDINHERAIYRHLRSAQGKYIPSVVNIRIAGYTVLAMQGFGKSIAQYNEDLLCSNSNGLYKALKEKTEEQVATLRHSLSNAVRKIHELGEYSRLALYGACLYSSASPSFREGNMFSSFPKQDRRRTTRQDVSYDPVQATGFKQRLGQYI